MEFSHSNIFLFVRCNYLKRIFVIYGNVTLQLNCDSPNAVTVGKRSSPNGSFFICKEDME